MGHVTPGLHIITGFYGTEYAPESGVRFRQFAYNGNPVADAATSAVLQAQPLGSVAITPTGPYWKSGVGPDVWTALGAGGGGVTTFAALTDTDVTSLTDGDLVTWDAAASRWKPVKQANWKVDVAGASGGKARLRVGSAVGGSRGVELATSVTNDFGSVPYAYVQGLEVLGDDNIRLKMGAADREDTPTQYADYFAEPDAEAGSGYQLLMRAQAGANSSIATVRQNHINLTSRSGAAELSLHGENGVIDLKLAGATGQLLMTQSTKVVQLTADGVATLQLDGNAETGSLGSANTHFTFNGTTDAAVITNNAGQIVGMSGTTGLLTLLSGGTGAAGLIIDRAGNGTANLSVNGGGTAMNLNDARAQVTAPRVVFAGTGQNGIEWPNATAPANTADAVGQVGSVFFDDDFMYRKTSGGWKRAALVTF